MYHCFFFLFLEPTTIIYHLVYLSIILWEGKHFSFSPYSLWGRRVDGLKMLLSIACEVMRTVFNDWRRERQFRVMWHHCGKEKNFPVLRKGESVRVPAADLADGEDQRWWPSTSPDRLLQQWGKWIKDPSWGVLAPVKKPLTEAHLLITQSWKSITELGDQSIATKTSAK